MARRRQYDYDDLPGLFDDLDLPPVPVTAIKETPTIEPPSDIYYMSFGSGSSGNCAYIGDSHGGFLVDAGVEPDRIFPTLLHNGVTPDMVHGVIITHDHGDHIRYVYSVVRKYRHIGVYCTPKAFNGIMRRHSISRRLKDYHRPIYKEFPFKIGDFEITAFETLHDGTDNAGFFITRGRHKFAVATDLGCISPRVDHYMRQANYIMIEANYDEEMLRHGPYNEFLKARIATDNGHLDNAVTGGFLAEIYHKELQAVFLCHLSNDNNLPALAIQTVKNALTAAHPGLRIGDGSNSISSRDADVQLLALPRYDASPLFRFRR